MNEFKKRQIALIKIYRFKDDMNRIIAPLSLNQTELQDTNGTYVWEQVPDTYDDSAVFRFRKVYRI